MQKKQSQESDYAFGATLDMGGKFWASVIAGAWLDALLHRQRPHIQTRLIAALILRMRQFSHLRFLLPLPFCNRCCMEADQPINLHKKPVSITPSFLMRIGGHPCITLPETG